MNLISVKDRKNCVCGWPEDNSQRKKKDLGYSGRKNSRTYALTKPIVWLQDTFK